MFAVLILLYVVRNANSVTIYNLNISYIPSTSSYQAAIIAGLWNKQQNQFRNIGKYDTIYLNRMPDDPLWLQTALDYYIEMTSSTLPSVVNSSLDTVISKAINSGIIKSRILYNPSQSYVIPTLTMLCNEYNAIPISNQSDYNNTNLPIIFNTINKWSNEYESTLFAYNRYLNMS
eukprot:424100_1